MFSGVGAQGSTGGDSGGISRLGQEQEDSVGEVGTPEL